MTDCRINKVIINRIEAAALRMAAAALWMATVALRMAAVALRMVVVGLMAVVMIAGLAGCGTKTETRVTVFAAKSLNNVMDEIIAEYNKTHPDITFITNYDGSGTLKTQIEEGADCDIFFSAGQSQMNRLEDQGLIVAGTRKDLLNNRVCLVKPAGSDSLVTGLDNIASAESFALAGGSVPVGKYTRVALMNAGLIKAEYIDGHDEAEDISAEEISESLGGLIINECANVGAVAAAVATGANEIGTVYYSDLYGYQDKLEIIELIPSALTGDVIYPVARVNNGLAAGEGGASRNAAADDFLEYLQSKEARLYFEKYLFDVR